MSAFTALSKEALFDAIRRRIVAAVILLCFFSLMAIDGFTSCAGNVSLNGEDVQLAEMAGATGSILFVTLGLWIAVLAAILASDHLQQTLEDGSANLSLARPVSRNTFALARLTGALAVALVTGAVLLGSAAGLLNLRSGLPLGPALIAGAHAGVAAFVCATFAMTLSLWLPRLATMLTMLGFIATMATANLMSFVPREEPWTGSLALLDRLGPPLAKAPIAALANWMPFAETGPAPFGSGAALWIWAVLGCAALLISFRRVELGR
jgi:ABC-type transport system involved in multi-copper enzyme maturation permease subunit